MKMSLCFKILFLHCLVNVLLAAADQRCDNGYGCPGDLQVGSVVPVLEVNCSSLQPGVILNVKFHGIVTLEYSCTLTVSNGSEVMSDSCVLIDHKPVNHGETIMKSLNKTMVKGTQCTFWGCYRIGFDQRYYSIPETSCIAQDSNVIDLNPCDAGIHNCSRHSRCIDTVEGGSCTCMDGLNGDVISCLNITHCPLNDGGCFNCSNHTGSYQCSCNYGFERIEIETGLAICEDVNECELGIHNCSNSASCDNMIGSYVCTCQNGYTGDGLDCELIDYGTPASTSAVEPSDRLVQITIPLVVVFGAVVLILIAIYVVTVVLLKRNNSKTKFKFSYDYKLDPNFDPVSVTDPPYPSSEPSYEPSLCEEFVHITIKRPSLYTPTISISDLLHAVSDAGMLQGSDRGHSDTWTVPVKSQSWHTDGKSNCMPSTKRNSLDSLELDMGVDCDTSDSDVSSGLARLPVDKELTNGNDDSPHAPISDLEEATEYIVLRDFRDGGV